MTCVVFHPADAEVSTVEEGKERTHIHTHTPPVAFSPFSSKNQRFITRFAKQNSVFPPTEEDLIALDEKCVEAGKAPFNLSHVHRLHVFAAL